MNNFGLFQYLHKLKSKLRNYIYVFVGDLCVCVD